MVFLKNEALSVFRIYDLHSSYKPSPPPLPPPPKKKLSKNYEHIGQQPFLDLFPIFFGKKGFCLKNWALWHFSTSMFSKSTQNNPKKNELLLRRLCMRTRSDLQGFCIYFVQFVSFRTHGST